MKDRVAAALRRRGRHLATWVAPLLPLTGAATAAWVIAHQFGDHDEPFFAPIAVVVALSSPVGERGRNAVRLLTGVFLGIATGEVTVLLLGGGYGRLALATFAAMALARLVGGPRLVMVQAAAGAILTVAAADGEAGVDRLIDGAIGAGVALFCSQVLLSPEPVRLVRRAAADALARLAESLATIARALESRDQDLAVEAMDRVRDVRDQLVEVARVRKASGRVARRSALWRSRIEPAVQEEENAGHLDLLSNSCLLLARTVARMDPDGPRFQELATALAPHVRALGRAVGEMAADPGDRAVRQTAADDALDVARALYAYTPPPGEAPTAAVVAMRMATVDVMVVAGVDHDDAAAAVQEGTGELRVPAPPRTPRLPFVPERRPRPPT